jgi:DNA gyrase inhibitor GyrI
MFLRNLGIYRKNPHGVATEKTNIDILTAVRKSTSGNEPRVRRGGKSGLIS